MNVFLPLLLACVFIVAVKSDGGDGGSTSKTLFYYSVAKHIGHAFVKQMKSDIGRATLQMAAEINETLVAQALAATPEEREEARSRMREQTAENHIFAALFKWNLEQVIDESCKRYELEIDDPCVSVDYDDEKEKCRVDYHCKTVEIAPGQRSAVPISDEEAQQKFDTTRLNK